MTFSRDMSQIVENALSRSVDESLKKFLDPDPEADDFLNLISSSLSTDHICTKIFTKIRSVVFTQNVENALSRSVDESFKKLLDPDPEAMTS